MAHPNIFSFLNSRVCKTLKHKKSKGLAIIAAAIFVLSGCASSNQVALNEGDIIISDPFEKANRVTYAFNTQVDKYAIYPVIRGYRAAVPPFARKGVSNFMINLSTPSRFANQLLQGDLNGAGDEATRFAVNTLLGLGGLIDIAAYEGIEYEPEDFGQTLAVWGVSHGPYFVTPFFGASTVRGYTGFIVDSTLMDPLGFYLNNTDENVLLATRFGVSYINLRDTLMDSQTEIEKSSIDSYAAIRSSYYQYRDSLIKDQKSNENYSGPAIPDYDDDIDLDY